MRAVAVCVGLAILVAAGMPALATETATYTYDALGRPVLAQHAGTVNNNLLQHDTDDPTDNRTNVTVTGSTNGSGS